MNRARAAAVLAAFVGSFVVVLLTPWCTRDQVVDPQAFVVALRANVDVIRPGDVVLVHPPWRDDVVAAIRQAGMLPGSRVTDALAPRHGDPLPPIVVITDGGLPLPRALAAQLDETTRRTTGGITLVRLKGQTPSAASEGHDFGARIAEALVEVRRGDEVIACPWDAIGRRHACPGLPEWMHVAEESLPVGGRKTSCVWAHPITDGAVVIRWDRPPLPGTITLELALTDGAADNAGAAAVTAELRIDGTSVGVLERTPGQRGFVPLRIPLPKVATSTPSFEPFLEPSLEPSLELILTTADDGQRHTCFRLTSGAR